MDKFPDGCDVCTIDGEHGNKCSHACHRDEHPLALKFKRIYANMPMPLRTEIVAIVGDNEPMTWQLIHLELEHNTKAAHEALDFLHKIEVI